jgi:serine/threonine protein phosphatase PrpC
VALRIAEVAALTDVGRARQSNEDSYLERSPLFVVADGMGGARAGEVASAIAVETAKDSEVGASPEQDLAGVVKAANAEIYRKAQEDSEHAGMGTTFTGALVTGDEVAIGHVGDSRMYRYRDGELERLTQDHSLVEEFVRQGKLTPEEAEVHPQRSIITRALGPEPDVQVDTFTYPGRDGDTYLICSDGLTGMISEDAIAEILSSSGSLEEAAKQLIDGANENGGRDNITVILFRLEDAGGEDGASDTLGDQATMAGVSADAVREAVAEADSGATQAREVPAPVQPPPSEARAGRDHTRVGRTFEGGVPASSPIAARRPPPIGRRRRIFAAVGLLLVLLAAVAVVWVVDRQFWFVGTTDNGQVALYQGLPYDLPLGIKMYSEERVSAVPATSITNPRQRKYVLDHHPRGHGDSQSLFEQIDSGSGATP